jgi:hypothetical protein
MSADDKVPGGNEATRPSSAGTETVKPAGKAAKPPMQADSQIDQKTSSRPRARNQDALPGILGKQLRAAYGELLSSPVPDQFTELIKRLESKEAASASSSDTPPDEESGQ